MMSQTSVENLDQSLTCDPLSARELLRRYREVRAFSDRLSAPLTPEDSVLQSMPDASPTRWHLAHTTWFFETFVLGRQSDYRPFNPDYAYLFNSYYNTLGKQFPRPQRGLLSRPGLREVQAYRAAVDERVEALIERGGLDDDLAMVLQVGLHHEQQHQELILTDIKHAFWCNPLFPAYQTLEFRPAIELPRDNWSEFAGGVYEFGHSGEGFCFDNERPRHRQFLHDFRLADRLVTNGQYLEFMRDDGYRRSEFWLSAGWDAVNQQGWQSPLYWLQRDGEWFEFTLAGLVPLDVDRPVGHVSLFEADAIAAWAGKRLPTEFEWELASGTAAEVTGLFADQLLDDELPLHPQVDSEASLMGNVWQWTGSQYRPYPGYRAPQGAIGEYNGKFMSNQFVLRGGSCASSRSHLRATYRNFFPPEARWQFSGIRLAEDAR